MRRLTHICPIIGGSKIWQQTSKKIDNLKLNFAALVSEVTKCDLISFLCGSDVPRSVKCDAKQEQLMPVDASMSKN